MGIHQSPTKNITFSQSVWVSMHFSFSWNARNIRKKWWNLYSIGQHFSCIHLKFLLSLQSEYINKDKGKKVSFPPLPQQESEVILTNSLSHDASLSSKWHRVYLGPYVWHYSLNGDYKLPWMFQPSQYFAFVLLLLVYTMHMLWAPGVPPSHAHPPSLFLYGRHDFFPNHALWISGLVQPHLSKLSQQFIPHVEKQNYTVFFNNWL